MSVAQIKNVNADPDENVVAELENALAMAKSGELRTIAMVGDLTGHRTFTSFSTKDMQQMIGKLSFLHFTICARQRENRE